LNAGVASGKGDGRDPVVALDQAPAGPDADLEAPLAEPKAARASSRRRKRGAVAHEDRGPDPAFTNETVEPAVGPTSAESLKLRLFSLRQSGFNRLYQDGRVFEFSTPESLLDVDFARPVYVLVDRLAIGPEIRQRLIDSVELCYREAGEAILEFVSAPLAAIADRGIGEGPALPSGQEAGARSATSPERLVFNERFECKRCQITYPEPE